MKHERMKQQAIYSLHKARSRRTQLLEELGVLMKSMEVQGDKLPPKEVVEREKVLQSSNRRVEAAISQYEDLLEECRIQEDEARCEDQDQPSSSEGSDDDVKMEPSEESNSPSGESPSCLRSHEAEPPVEVSMKGDQVMALEGDVTVSPEEDDILTGAHTSTEDQGPTSDPTSMAGELAKLHVHSPSQQKHEDRETSK